MRAVHLLADFADEQWVCGEPRVGVQEWVHLRAAQRHRALVTCGKCLSRAALFDLADCDLGGEEVVEIVPPRYTPYIE